jgi:hypothetical protein
MAKYDSHSSGLNDERQPRLVELAVDKGSQDDLHATDDLRLCHRLREPDGINHLENGGLINMNLVKLVRLRTDLKLRDSKSVTDAGPGTAGAERGKVRVRRKPFGGFEQILRRSRQPASGDLSVTYQLLRCCARRVKLKRLREELLVEVERPNGARELCAFRNGEMVHLRPVR